MDGDSNSRSSVGVIGAGIQGVCTSLYLIKKGFNVTLIDRDDPGKVSACLLYTSPSPRDRG